MEIATQPIISADEGAAYLESLEDLDQRGAFFMALTVSLSARRGT